jgi:hypothetical protein
MHRAPLWWVTVTALVPLTLLRPLVTWAGLFLKPSPLIRHANLKEVPPCRAWRVSTMGRRQRRAQALLAPIADLKITNELLDDDEVGIGVIALIAEWHLGWSRFWALRHPDREVKEWFAVQFANDLEVRQPKIRELTKGSLDG